jgi:hypothetical protein
MAALELTVSQGIARDPANMGDADDVPVQVDLENAGATGWATSIDPTSRR